MSTSPPVVLRARDLGVSIGGLELVRGVDLEVAAGERVALLGPSGAGKSLLLRALLGTLPPAAVRTGDLLPAARATWVQQDSTAALHPSVRVGRQLGRPLRRTGLGRTEVRSRVARALEEVGLDPARVQGALPAELSGGERQRVCLALAVLVDAGESGVLLADEPTTALDTVSQAQVLDAVRRVPGAVVLVSHDVAVAASLCSRALVLADGEVVEQGPFARLLRDPRHPVTRDLVRRSQGRVAA